MEDGRKPLQTKAITKSVTRTSWKIVFLVTKIPISSLSLSIYIYVEQEREFVPLEMEIFVSKKTIFQQQKFYNTTE